jgi:hypothetical protein
METMYAIRPHSSVNLELDLPTSMYAVRPVIGQASVSQATNETALVDIAKRQDALLERIEHLYNQVNLYQKKGSNDAHPVAPVREELVVHLSAKQPSTNILNLIDQFHDQLSIRTFRHSSLKDLSAYSQVPKLSSSTAPSAKRSLTVVWADGEDLPFMFHSHMKITDEQFIVNLLSHQLTNP